MRSSSRHHPGWFSLAARVAFLTFLLTLLSFAIALLLSIIGLVIAAGLHGGSPDLRFAYRNVALPAGIVAGAGAFVISLVMEVRHYRQAKTLAGIVRASR
jgi:hypothetical protein